ncbi:hypothetical protein SRRS_02240 [Sporomusa rhizae]|uniref:Flp family type IVb pilin n=1 Tax=Sporomusa rhizae TaxID=357999 RepID=UPI00352A2EC9
MLKMYVELIKTRFFNEKGQGMVEYGLILALVAVGAMVAFGNLGDGIVAKLTQVTGQLTGP